MRNFLNVIAVIAILLVQTLGFSIAPNSYIDNLNNENINLYSPAQLIHMISEGYHSKRIVWRSLYSDFIGKKFEGGKGPLYVSAAALLLKENGVWYVLLTKRGKDAADNKGEWAWPAGKVDNKFNQDIESEVGLEKLRNLGVLSDEDFSVQPGIETPLGASIRETREETGILLEKGVEHIVGRLNHKKGHC